jgi:ubiquinone biosynthesis protein
VLTLERLSGIKINMVEQLEEQGVDRRALARNLTAGFMEHYLGHGMFHADPHPGNLLVSSDGCINLVDFGLVGHLSEEMRSQLAATLFAVTRRDIDTFVEVYSEIGVFDRRTHAIELKTDLAELLDKYYGLPLVQIDIKRVFDDVTETARRHHVMLPRDFVLLGKSFVAVISTARKLDPEYDLGTLAESTAKLISKERFSPSRIKRLLTTELWQIGRLLQRLPRDLRNLITSVQEGRLQLVFRHEGLENLTTEIDKSSNRLSFSITLAAIIIGSSLIIAAGVGPKVQGISLLGVVGYLLAGVLGAWLAVAILRAGKL